LPIMGESIETTGPQMTLRNLAILPAILIVAFILFSFWVRKKGSDAG